MWMLLAGIAWGAETEIALGIGVPQVSAGLGMAGEVRAEVGVAEPAFLPDRLELIGGGALGLLPDVSCRSGTAACRETWLTIRATTGARWRFDERWSAGAGLGAYFSDDQVKDGGAPDGDRALRLGPYAGAQLRLRVRPELTVGAVRAPGVIDVGLAIHAPALRPDRLLVVASVDVPLAVTRRPAAVVASAPPEDGACVWTKVRTRVSGGHLALLDDAITWKVDVERASEGPGLERFDALDVRVDDAVDGTGVVSLTGTVARRWESDDAPLPEDTAFAPFVARAVGAGTAVVQPLTRIEERWAWDGPACPADRWNEAELVRSEVLGAPRTVRVERVAITWAGTTPAGDALDPALVTGRARAELEALLGRGGSWVSDLPVTWLAQPGS